MNGPSAGKPVSPKGSPAPRSDERHARDPLHGITLADILYALVERLGWEKMGSRINIRCFLNDPSIKSSLTFLRRTPWARKKVEELYLETFVLKEEEPPRAPKKPRPLKEK